MLSAEDKKLVQALQQSQKKVLQEFDRVCKELGLEYCLAFGSSLGAIRHKGFIPWDDDIDVYMRIKDLETLQLNAKRFDNDFFLQYHESDPDYGLMITRLRNSNTTLIEKSEINRDINHGVFIDIYPLFNSPERGLGACKLIVASMLYRLMLYGVPPKNRGFVLKAGSSILLHVIPMKIRNVIMRYCYRVMRNSPKTGYYSSLYGNQVNIRYPERWFFPAKWVPFDDIEVPVESNYDEYLRRTYGDYMQMPPEDKRRFHHGYAFVDLEKSYKYYKGTQYCMEKEL